MLENDPYLAKIEFFSRLKSAVAHSKSWEEYYMSLCDTRMSIAVSLFPRTNTCKLDVNLFIAHICGCRHTLVFIGVICGTHTSMVMVNSSASTSQRVSASPLKINLILAILHVGIETAVVGNVLL